MPLRRWRIDEALVKHVVCRRKLAPSEEHIANPLERKD